MPKLRHFDRLGTARFVTFTCFQRYPYLSEDYARRILLEGLVHLRTHREIRILAWVAMPDHVHLILHPPTGLKLGPAIGRLKNWTARQILNAPEFGGVELHRSDGRQALCQRRFYDHSCRSLETVRQKIDYCHMNPVSTGLVEQPCDWPWSSYNWYRGAAPVVLDIDGIEL
jgi:putative transposase